MIFWSIEQLAIALKKDEINPGQLVIYFIGMISLLLLGCSVFTFLPLLYYQTFGFIKSYLEREASPLPLTIQVFDVWHTWFLLLMIVIVIVGILSCYHMNQRGDKKAFVIRFICLNWPITLRIIMVTALLYCVGMFIVGMRYLPQLKELSTGTVQKESTHDGNPLAFLQKTISQVNIFQTVVGKINKMQEAKIVFKNLSMVSLYFYILTHIGALLSALYYFIVMRRVFNRIAFLDF